jgi:hypothetical protein
MENEIYYTQESVESILNIFSKNGIKLEFDDPYSLIKTLQTVGELTSEKHLELTFLNSKKLVLLEFDIARKKIISSGIGYSCSTIDYCPYVQVKQQLGMLYDIFNFHVRHLIDLNGIYGVMYNGTDVNQVEGFYYWLDRGILYDITLESWDYILEVFNLSQKNINFLKKENANMHLDYIGFDTKNIIRKVAFATNKEAFLFRNPEKQYKNYKNMNPIIKLLGDYFNEDNDWMSLQYSPQNQKYLAIEFSLDPFQVRDFANEMYKRNIIDESEHFNFVDMNIPAEYQTSILKFRWDDEENFSIKFYLEEFIDCPSRED